MIEELSVEAGQEITLVVQPTPSAEGEDPANQSLNGDGPKGVTMSMSSYRMPDIYDRFTVVVKAGKDNKEVLVKLERPQVKKPFLGGYKHKVSGIEYHHASVQTLTKRKEDNGVSG